jgi:hypothetical protein
MKTDGAQCQDCCDNFSGSNQAGMGYVFQGMSLMVIKSVAHLDRGHTAPAFGPDY